MTYLIEAGTPDEFEGLVEEKLNEFADKKQYPKVDVQYSYGTDEAGSPYTALIMVQKI